MSVKIRNRRTRAFQRLESQLNTGNKPEKIEGRTTSKQIPLNESDKKRISKELDILKNRL